MYNQRSWSADSRLLLSGSKDSTLKVSNVCKIMFENALIYNIKLNENSILELSTHSISLSFEVYISNYL